MGGEALASMPSRNQVEVGVAPEGEEHVSRAPSTNVSWTRMERSWGEKVGRSIAEERTALRRISPQRWRAETGA
jgi:hypothetical protein